MKRLLSDVRNIPITKSAHSYMIKDRNGHILSKLDYYDYNMKDFDWVLLANIETLPSYRGMGLASKLINRVYKDVIENDSNKGVYLFVRRDNTNAIDLYKKLNFRKIKNYSLADGDYIIMAKGNTHNMYQFDEMNFS